MKSFYCGDTQILTTRGFVTLSNLKDEKIIYLANGELNIADSYKVIKEAKELELYSLGESYVYCNKEVKDKLHINYKIDLPKKITMPKVNFTIDSSDGYLDLDIALVYSFLFLNYFNIDYGTNTLTYIPYKNPKSFNLAVYHTMSKLNSYLLDNKKYGSFPWLAVDKITKFRSDYFSNSVDNFYSTLLTNFQVYQSFLVNLNFVDLLYTGNGKDKDKCFLKCVNYSLDKLILFLLSLSGFTCASLLRKESKNGITKTYNLIVSYKLKEKVKPKLIKGESKSCEAYSVSLPKDGLLITSTLYKGFTSVALLPSYSMEV